MNGLKTFALFSSTLLNNLYKSHVSKSPSTTLVLDLGIYLWSTLRVYWLYSHSEQLVAAWDVWDVLSLHTFYTTGTALKPVNTCTNQISLTTKTIKILIKYRISTTPWTPVIFSIPKKQLVSPYNLDVSVSLFKYKQYFKVQSLQTALYS